jgi:diguanylate cyclase (GGDEF)-like protein
MFMTSPRRRPDRPTRVLIHPVIVQLLLIMWLLRHSAAAVALAIFTMANLLMIHRAVTGRVRALHTALDLANTDMVTGLPTRRLIYDHLSQTAANQMLTVAVADVDDLKPLNDVHGHQTGDAYLAAVAARLQSATTEGDVLVRLGGDEFALASTRPADQVAAHLAEALARPANIAGQAWPLHLSIGIYRCGGGDPHTALGRAEAAMYTAKRRRTGVEQYDPWRDGDVQPAGIRPRRRRRDQPSPDVVARPGVISVRPVLPPIDAT